MVVAECAHVKMIVQREERRKLTQLLEVCIPCNNDAGRVFCDRMLAAHPALSPRSRRRYRRLKLAPLRRRLALVQQRLPIHMVPPAEWNNQSALVQTETA
jgi:hypothetical protein